MVYGIVSRHSQQPDPQNGASFGSASVQPVTGRVWTLKSNGFFGGGLTMFKLGLLR
jgi:hypothetical protein